MNGNTTFLLVHGSWHVGNSWSAVAAHLREAGFPVSAPTLAGHGVDCDPDGSGEIRKPRLYQLIRQRGRVQDRTFEIEFLDPGVQVFSFTFG